MTNEEAAWLAGYIDGDGALMLCKCGGKYTRRPILVIDSCDKEILEYVATIAEGNVVQKNKAKGKQRATFTWRQASPNKILEILEKCEPFMRCAFKKNRAQMLLREWKLVAKPNGWYSREQAEARIDFERRFMATGANRGARTRFSETSFPTVEQLCARPRPPLRRAVAAGIA